MFTQKELTDSIPSVRQKDNVIYKQIAEEKRYPFKGSEKILIDLN